MKRADYPRTYREAGRVSREKQALYKRLTRANLALLGVGAAFALLGAAVPEFMDALVALGALCVAAAVIVWLVLGVGRPENEWFDARAVAESLKTMTWRFSMRAEPYNSTGPEQQVESVFLDEIKQVLDLKPHIAAQLDCPPDEPEITTEMRRLRAASYTQRLDAYLEGRVRDQKNWYNSKSQRNRTASKLWFWCAFALQVGALVAAVVAIFGSALDLSGFLVTLAALVMTWLQVQQSSYLAHSYGSAAQEFATIESKASGVDSEAAFEVYVEQAELAASREHTLWVARNTM